jgi:hypothetical protein
MDVVFGLDSTLYAMVTGSATSFEAGGTTGVASIVYSVAGTPLWTKGALWNRDPLIGGTGDDEGVAVRCIRALDTGLDGSLFNAYVAVKSHNGTPTGWDYAMLKYDGRQFPGVKDIAWDHLRVPLYTGPGTANPNNTPSGIAVEYNPGITDSQGSRRIWITGTSNGGATADDWATQFVVERLDP